MKMQTAVNAVFPPDCVCCGAPVQTEFGLCATCWGDTPFITGASCDQCGTPLPGVNPEPGLRCDDCLSIARPWGKGRAVFTYAGNGRKMVLRLKHGDQPAIARAAGKWMATRAAPLITDATLIVPIPLHWWRLFRRRVNQSALLAQALANETQGFMAPDALQRTRRTETQEGKDREGRFANLRDSIHPHPKRGHILAGRDVLLVDDVMTSGATFAAAAQACHDAGAETVCVMALARVAKDA
ncbi:MAG: amidophosphoribosyltransferase [Rhodobacteraceae bacterium CG17_big_fil_post_rev_8_21_14_2_50_65_11]|nr:MAG: amidophosphoribosyltransferase [Rhodobacteraceae bacterium CG17_big_fil_post_rev_8_21_14_2_50_65_11]